MIEGIAASTAPVEEGHTLTAVAWRLAPAAVGLGSLCLGAVALGHRSLTSDEAAVIDRARQPLGELVSTIVHDDPGQAGQLLVLKLAESLGSDELAARAPSVIAVALSAALLVVLGTILFDRLAGVVAGLALATNAGVVEASRTARPAALGLLGVVAATLLFVLALERGGRWRWLAYAIVAACLPLTHPLAASVLAAHGATLVARRDRPDLRGAGIALLAGTATAALLLCWMAADRFDADGSPQLDLDRLGAGLARAAGWSPLLVAAAAAGLFVLFRRPAGEATLTHWRGFLVAGSIAAPAAALLLAAALLPVFIGPLVLAAPGLALAAGAAVPLFTSRPRLAWAALAALLCVAVATIGMRLSAPPSEDWRALAAAVKRVRGAEDTVVVVPERSRAAFAFYAPYVPIVSRARREGAWIAVVADSPAAAIAGARPSVSTPRYALARQFRYGDRLRLQHWVRP